MNAPTLTPRYVSAEARATTFLTDAVPVTAEELRTAAKVFEMFAAVDRRPLNRAMTTDLLGNPITNTPERMTAWSTSAEAMDVSDRARAWARYLTDAAVRREQPAPAQD